MTFKIGILNVKRCKINNYTNGKQFIKLLNNC